MSATLFVYSPLVDVILSLTVIAVALVVFIRLVHDYRLVYTVGYICRKSYRVEFSQVITIPLCIYELCRNVHIVQAWCPQAEQTLVKNDHVEIRGLAPDVIRGEASLYIKLRVYGLLDQYEFRRKIRLTLR